MTESNYVTSATDLDDILAPRGWFRSSGSKIFSAGINVDGQLGTNNVLKTCLLVQEFTQSGSWSSIAAGASRVIALKSNGSLWAWGNNGQGQLGNNCTQNRSSPVQEITSSSDWCYVSASGFASAAIKNDNSLWLWGNGIDGGLASDNLFNKSSPTQEITASSWRKVNGGNFSTFGAIKTDGTLWSWGCGASGSLGNNCTLNRSSPVQEITNSSDWCDLSVGASITSAIKTDGTLWSWGSGQFGALGNNCTTDRSSPVQEISNSNNWKSTSSGSAFSQAIRKDGSLWMWGMTLLDDIATVSSPVQETLLSYDWHKNNVGASDSAAIKTDGTLWVWGANVEGSLGNGTNTSIRVQTQNGIKTTWKDIAMGYSNLSAIEMSDTLC